MINGRKRKRNPAKSHLHPKVTKRMMNLMLSMKVLRTNHGNPMMLQQVAFTCLLCTLR